MSVSATRASLAGLILAAALGAAALMPKRADAVACAPGLTVAGQPVTGDDCVTNGDGSITIDKPKFGTSGAVNIAPIPPATTAKMILNSAKTSMAPENVAIPLQLNVGTKGVMFGTMSVGNNELCDIDAPAPDPQPNINDVPPNPDAAAKDTRVTDAAGKVAGSVFQPVGVGCRTIPSFKLDFSNFNELGKIVGIDVGKFSAKIPTVIGFDDNKGGRVFTTVPFKLPKQLDQEVEENGVKKKVPTFIGIGGEISAAEGFKPSAVGFRLNKSLPLGPGLALDQLSGVFDPAADRLGGGLLLRLPGNKAIGAALQLANGEITKLSGDVTLPTPVPLFAGIKVTAIGGSIQTATKSTLPDGSTSTSPQVLQGRMKFIVGPSVGKAAPFQGDASLTIAGSSFKLAGNLFTVFPGNKQVKLGDAKVLIQTKPTRVELEANANLFSVITAHAFLGFTGDPAHFTALGEASVQIPKEIKFIGGQKLGGFQFAFSDVGVGALITIDPPLVKPLSIGVGTKLDPFKLTKIDSIQQFITVKPSAASAARAFASGRPVALTAAQKNVTLPKSSADLIVEVAGKGKAPRNVKLSIKGKKLTVVKLGSGGNAAQYAIVKSPGGQLNVSSPDALGQITVGRVKEFPYLDPSPGFGSVPKGPVTAGQPANVCWKIKNAPKGAVVDLFEDQNGNLGTGRQIATGRPANGCFDVPTAGLEPGKHWVYGTVRTAQGPLDQRYWPIPLTIVDPSALPAPSGVTVTPNADGATVGWSEVAGAAGYIIRAEPADEYDGEPIEVEASATQLTSDISLRGAKDWNVTVQAFGSDGGKGNTSAPQRTAATDPVVLAGKPSGVAEVGKLWAFQLKSAPGVALKLISGPPGMTLNGGVAQLRWTPAKSAGAATPQQFVVEGCKADRCVRRTFNVSAYAKGFAPFGPARGFQVTPNVVKAGQVVTIRAQGIDATPVVKVDGKVVKVTKVNSGALEFKAPKLAKGAHDVSLKIGSDFEERKPGALIVV
jgi:IPT/TIG domain